MAIGPMSSVILGLISRLSLYKIAHFCPISAGQLHPFGLIGRPAFGRKQRHQLSGPMIGLTIS
jgi:hypothetical protein